MDGHGSVTALAETNETGTVVTDTYTYDAYGTLLKKTGTTDNDYLYTGEQYNEATGLYYLRARYMNPETGTFISMDSYAGSLDNPVSLHKYLYANANPVMYTDPTGYFSLSETSVVQGMKSVLNTGMQSLGNLRKVMSWANMAVTLYDIHEQIQLLQSGEGSILGLVLAIAGGIVTQAFLNCTLTKLLGNAANTVLKVIGVAQDAGSFLKAVKSGDPEKIVVETIRLIVSIFTLKCQCFTGETLVSTTEGDKQIDEIEVGDYVYAYDTETGENIAAKVTYVSITETDILVHVYTSEGEEIKTTMLHPFYVKNAKSGDEEHGVWKAASNLVKGDELLTEDGRIVYVEEIRIERLTESIQVYNLEVEGLHTYYVGSGVLVHNEYGVPKNKSTLWGKEKNVTENGLNLIKEHLSGELSDEFNIAMIERIENAFKNGNKITGADLDFYAHEIYEAMMMSKGMTYENAHDAAKAFYNAIEYNFYHPDVIKKLKRLFGSSWFEFWDIERD